MANPVPDEDKLYKILKDENIKIHPIIWQLLDHHIRNDLNGISVIVGDIFDQKAPLSEENTNAIVKRIKNISELLRKLQKATNWDGKYYYNVIFPGQEEKKNNKPKP